MLYRERAGAILARSAGWRVRLDSERVLPRSGRDAIFDLGLWIVIEVTIGRQYVQSVTAGDRLKVDVELDRRDR